LEAADPLAAVVVALEADKKRRKICYF
jgi:hypothetical protein